MTPARSSPIGLSSSTTRTTRVRVLVGETMPSVCVCRAMIQDRHASPTRLLQRLCVGVRISQHVHSALKRAPTAGFDSALFVCALCVRRKVLIDDGAQLLRVVRLREKSIA